MQRRKYSVERPIPRQTLWNRLRKRRKLQSSEEEVHKASEGEDNASIDALSDSERESTEGKDTASTHASDTESEPTEEKGTISTVTSNTELEPTEEERNVSVDANDTGKEPTHKIPVKCTVLKQHADTSQLEPSQHPQQAFPVPSLNPSKHCLDSDGELSDNEFCGNLDAIYSDDSSVSSSHDIDIGNITSGEESDTSQGRQGHLLGNESESSESRIWFEKHTVSTAAASSHLDEPSCPPEVKYPTLLHILRTKHKLTKDAMDDVIEIVNDISMTGLKKTVLPNDARTLVKMHEKYLPTAQKHFLCLVCGAYVGMQQSGVDNYSCTSCESSSSFRESDYFYYLPLSEQLRQLFEDNYEEVSVVFKKPSEGKSHIIANMLDGLMYKSFLKEIGDEVQYISITFSCDGVPVFSSSGSSLWPLLCKINELPMHIRKRHLLMPAVFYGTDKKKPDMNQFLYPFVKECNELYMRGFTYYRNGRELVCKVATLVGVSDSVARPLLLNSQQFNGEFGCSICYHPGQQVPKGRGSVRVYPHKQFSIRTCEETKLLAKEASLVEKKPFHVKGIKGDTVLSYLLSFDVIRGLVPDYMHSSILGTTRQFAKLWFNSENHDKPFYIGNAKTEINRRLGLLKPPLFVSRPPRSLDDMKFWKAHEWHGWAFFYSVAVLKGILPNRLLQHWMLFVEGLFLLTQERILKSQIYNAIELLVLFSKGTEELYGIEHCSFNVHLGEHLGETSLNWGPLWEISGYLYEDHNQVLLGRIHSSKGVLDQVVKETRIARSIPTLLSTPAGIAVSHMNVTKTERLLSENNSISCSNVDCDTLALVPKAKAISNVDRLALVSINLQVKPEKKMLFCKRIILNREVFHSKAYTEVKKKIVLLYSWTITKFFLLISTLLLKTCVLLWGST